MHSAGRDDDLTSLLSDFRWLDTRLRAAGVVALLADYHWAGEDGELRLIEGAIRLSSHVLPQDNAQLPSQLWGRLSPTDGPAVADLLDSARCLARDPWLRPLRPTLTRPGGPLLRTLEGDTGSVLAVAVTPDGKSADALPRG